METLTLEDYIKAGLFEFKNIRFATTLTCVEKQNICEKLDDIEVSFGFTRERVTLVYEDKILLGGFTSYEYQVLLQGDEEGFITIIDKVDTTGYGKTPKVMKKVLKSYLDYRKYHYRESRHLIYLFAKPQPQYLFKNSKRNINKKMLNDKQLINYWVDILDSPLFEVNLNYKKYIYVPGNELGQIKSLVKNSLDGWNYSTIYNENDIVKQVILNLNDDCLTRLSKSEYNQDLSIKEFLLILPFTEECNTGQLVATFFLSNFNMNCKKGLLERDVLDKLLMEAAKKENQSGEEDNESTKSDNELDHKEEGKNGYSKNDDASANESEDSEDSESLEPEDLINEIESRPEEEKSFYRIFNIITNTSDFSTYEKALKASQEVETILLDNKIPIHEPKSVEGLKFGKQKQVKRSGEINVINTSLIKRKK
ncbi:hypothetical protein K502DRAFT_330811 [Neoconidiobolus thromboides FSU 785]|nr:hypothetical protein K502DRAFT_330811 [Neoconidiobolus thromboides FSU 785]